MVPSARISAAIEVLADIAARRRPATDALKDWGLAHRFAGSGDRAAIASLVYDCLRRKYSAAFLLGEETPRAVMLGMLRLQRNLDPAAIEALFNGERFSPKLLSTAERERIGNGFPLDAPLAIAADCPDWIAPVLMDVFGGDFVAELRAMADRAPLDLRVNTLTTTRDKVLDELAYLTPVPTPFSPVGLRIRFGDDGRGPAIQAEPAFLDGWVEIQDEGSQLVAFLSGARPGETIVDLCAGGGGKTLALAATMQNSGILYATDSDIRRLAPIHERLRRAGITNTQVRTPRGREYPLDDLKQSADIVLVDAPCTGSGTWRRNPDAKWRLRPGSVAARLKDQATVLDRATELVKPGGRIAYITCSVLPEENDGAVAAFLGRTPGFSVADARANLTAGGFSVLLDAVRFTRHGVQLTPLRTGTDGFFLSILRKVG